ncbi:MAG: hypothetical protein QGI68_17465 [Pseudomonadales bacterium]|jgi:hypothetical protein|nr:hypothetical protein [Pseudomonadales bacterium]MDP7597334.1 hypothetical protein [Pseudomonadales bacterium]HJN49265.1 hypothetical protein [Pseudomonadales bacterium]
MASESHFDHAQWLLNLTDRDSPSVSIAEIADHVSSSVSAAFQAQLPSLQSRFQSLNWQRCHRVAPEILHAEFVDEKGKPGYYRLGFNKEGLLQSYLRLRSLPPDIVVRLADQEDWDGVFALESQCPIETGDGKRVFVDRGERAVNHFRLPQRMVLAVAEHNHQIIASRALPVRDCVLDGNNKRLVYSHFARTLPEYQAIGLFAHLNIVAMEEVGPFDAMFAYMDPQNEAMRAAAQGGRGWDHKVLRISINCRQQADGNVSNRPAAADIGSIAAVINGTHEQKFFFEPYSESKLRGRLQRAPDSYGPDDLHCSGNAVIGVNWEGQIRRTEWQGKQTRTVHGQIMDFGFQGETGLEELRQLIQAACAAGISRGMTHLIVFTSGTCVEATMMSGLAEQVQEYEFFYPEPPPYNIDQRGLYVDPVYF